MKKTIALLIVALSVFTLVGCTNNGEGNSQAGVEELVGHMVIKDDTLHFDSVEIVKLEDKERMEELMLTDEDMPNGYSIINENQEEETYELADEVEYIFTDLSLDFVDESEADGDRLYITNDKEEFLQHLNEYNLNDIPLFEQTIPYFIEVKDGKVIKIEEKFEYTI